MLNVVSFRQEIVRLEDEKWELLLSLGPEGAERAWPAIDARLGVLYSWLSNDAGASS